MKISGSDFLWVLSVIVVVLSILNRDFIFLAIYLMLSALYERMAQR